MGGEEDGDKVSTPQREWTTKGIGNFNHGREVWGLFGRDRVAWVPED